MSRSPRAPARGAAADYPQVAIRSRDELRSWLDGAHATARGAWVVTWKRHTGEAYVAAAEVAEEALCFGWIDSLPRALDADRSMLLISPRSPRSAWSRVNKERVARLVDAGRMTPAGLAAVAAARASGTWSALDAVEALTLPDDLVVRFDAAPPAARAHFDAFPRSVKRAILEWLHGAKKPETRARRVEETVTLAERNLRANQWRPDTVGS